MVNSIRYSIFYWYGQFLTNPGISARICTDLYRFAQKLFLKLQKRGVFFRRALFNQLISFSKTEFMTIQFSNNPGISVRICVDLYRFAGSAQHGTSIKSKGDALEGTKFSKKKSHSSEKQLEG